MNVALASQEGAGVNDSLGLALISLGDGRESLEARGLAGAGVTGSLGLSFDCCSSITGEQGAGRCSRHWNGLLSLEG